MRPPVLLIGAHRSGTSATAHALEILGLQIGQKLDSHFEPKPLQQLHDDYLRKIGASWYDPEPFLESIRRKAGEQQCVDFLRKNLDRHFARIFGYRKNPRGLWRLFRLKCGAPWGWKEPRTTLFAQAWLKIFPSARIVHIVRNTRAAAASIQARELKFQAAGDAPTGKTDDLDYCIRLVDTYVKAAERLSGREGYLQLQFEEIQDQPDKMLAATARFCSLGFRSKQLDMAAATIRPRCTVYSIKQPL